MNDTTNNIVFVNDMRRHYKDACQRALKAWNDYSIGCDKVQLGQMTRSELETLAHRAQVLEGEKSTYYAAFEKAKSDYLNQINSDCTCSPRNETGLLCPACRFIAKVNSFELDA